MARNFPGKKLSRDALSKLNPDKIYVENVRSLLDVSYASAVELLEDGMRQGWLKSGVEVMCPDGTVAATVENGDALPETVTCTQEDEGHPEDVELPTSSLSTRKFYRLNDRTISVVVGRSS